MKIIGVNIKRLREEQGITLRELAKRLNVSASLLSQIETGKASPSLSTLKNIADNFGTTIGDLVGEGQKPVKNPVVRKQDRKTIKDMAKGMRLFLLSSPDPNKQMEPLLFQLEPKSSSGESMYKHFGQEFILVLKGTVEITLNDTKYILKKGDSIYFNSSIPHSFRNIDSGLSEALWVDTPPTF